MLSHKTCLAFEGGGILGIAHIGALSRFAELGGLSKVSHVVGTSVGSFIAAALGCGADFDFLQQTFLDMEFPKFKDSSNKCKLSNLIRLFRKFGPNKGTEIKRVASKIIEDLTGNKDTTFLQAFQRFGVCTTIVYLSVNYNKTRYANYLTKPQMKIRDAIYMSSAIPTFYQPATDKTTDELIVDGGVTDNYPIHILEDQGCPQENILGFKLCSQSEFNEYHEDLGEEVEEIDRGKPTKLFNYLIRLVEIIHSQALRFHVKEHHWKNTVKIDIGELKTTDFDLSKDQQTFLYENGRLAVDKYLEKI